MIEKHEGRHLSRRTREETVAILKQQLSELTPEQRKLVREMMREQMKGSTTLTDYMNDSRWLRKPVSVMQFLEDPY